jgi:hypothetical protein
MLMSKKIGWLMLATAVLLHCGGKSVTDIAGSDDDTAAGGSTVVSNAGSGGTADNNGCIDSGVPEGGCGGEGGEKPLEPYARLRTACGLNANVNRNGTPAPISLCFN